MDFSYKEVAIVNEEADRITNTYMKPLALLKYFFTRRPRILDVISVVYVLINTNTVYSILSGSSGLVEELNKLGLWLWMQAIIAILVTIGTVFCISSLIRSTKIDALEEAGKELDPKLRKLICDLVHCK